LILLRATAELKTDEHRRKRKTMMDDPNRAQQKPTDERAGEIVTGLEILSALFNQRLSETVQALENQSQLINQRLTENVQGLDNQTQVFINRLEKLIEGVQNQSQLLCNKLDALIEGTKNQSDLINRKLDELILGLENHSRGLDEKLDTQNDIQNSQLEAIRALRHTREHLSDTQREQIDCLDALLDEICAKSITAQQAAKVFDRILRDIVRPHHQTVFWGDRMLTLDKSAGFREDQGFREALQEATSSTGMNQYESPDGISWRYNTLIWAAHICLALPGDFVECGVYRGDMAWMITRTIDLSGAGKTFYLYDTFGGFDLRHSSEADFPDAPNFFAFANQVYSAADIEDQVRQRFRNDRYIVVTKGSVPDVLHQQCPDSIAFLHLDMNSARAETGALEVLFHRISSGGIIVFDDYGWKLFRKQKEAADRFMAAHGQIVMELPTGQGLTIKR
jgi:hypothetical protein